MKKSDEQLLRRKIGDLNSVCGWKDYLFNDGPARGVRAFDLVNGRGIGMTVLADRGLDVSGLTYKGHQMSVQSKTGIKSPFSYQEDGVYGFLKQFYVGMLTTCGLTYAGAPNVDEGQSLGLHGPFNNIPASRVSAEMAYEGEEAVIRLSGEIRQSAVFSDNLVMKRVIRLQTERDAVHIEDTVENQGFFDSPLMILYHINFGYPMLDAGAKIYSSASNISPRDGNAAKGLPRWNEMEEPAALRPEECFFHTGFKKDAFTLLHNERLGIAAAVRFDPEALPMLCEWKNMREGDYALGLEPGNFTAPGRAAARKDGSLILLQPGERRTFRVSLEFTDDGDVIRDYIARAR